MVQSFSKLPTPLELNSEMCQLCRKIEENGGEIKNIMSDRGEYCVVAQLWFALACCSY